MVRTYWPCVPVVLLIAMSTAPALADTQPVCSVVDEPLLITQNDANSGQDAPDVLPEALVLPQQDDYLGTLQLPSGTGDPSDWYGLRVGPQHERVMVSLHSYNDDGLIDWGELIVVDVVPPGTAEPVVTVPMDTDLVILPGQPAMWSFGVRFADDFQGACPEGGGLAKIDPMLTNYSLYVGCDPVCAEGL